MGVHCTLAVPADPRTAYPRSLLCCRPLSAFIAIGFEHCIANMVRSSLQGVECGTCSK